MATTTEDLIWAAQKMSAYFPGIGNRLGTGNIQYHLEGGMHSLKCGDQVILNGNTKDALIARWQDWTHGAATATAPHTSQAEMLALLDYAVKHHGIQPSPHQQAMLDAFFKEGKTIADIQAMGDAFREKANE